MFSMKNLILYRKEERKIGPPFCLFAGRGPPARGGWGKYPLLNPALAMSGVLTGKRRETALDSGVASGGRGWKLAPPPDNILLMILGRKEENRGKDKIVVKGKWTGPLPPPPPKEKLPSYATDQWRSMIPLVPLKVMDRGYFS